MEKLLASGIFVITASFGPMVFASQDLDMQMLAEVRKVSPEVNRISHRDAKEIDNRHSIVAIYALTVHQTTRQHYRRGTETVEETPLSGQKIGVFIIDNKLQKVVITLDIMQSERSNDFYPRIQSVSQTEATVGFVSDYGVEGVKRYEFDLKLSKLLGISRLPPPPRATMCNHRGKIEPCYD